MIFWVFIVIVQCAISACLGQRLCPQQPPTNRVRVNLILNKNR